jgi:6-phosphofructokinase
VCLIPEVAFKTEKLLAHIGQLLDTKGHAVVCVAEGAGQDLMASGANGGASTTDASGNAILRDVGMYLRDAFKAHFKGEADVKYIDPSYIIRSIPTTTNDRIYCKVLGQGAVHGAFAGESLECAARVSVFVCGCSRESSRRRVCGSLLAAPPLFCWHTRACLPESLPKPTPIKRPKHTTHHHNN